MSTIPVEFVVCRHAGDIRSLSLDEVEDLMGRMRSDICSADNRRRKLQRVSSTEDHTEEIKKLRLEIQMLWQDLEKLARLSKLAIFDYSQNTTIPAASGESLMETCLTGQAGTLSETPETCSLVREVRTEGVSDQVSHASVANKRPLETSSEGDEDNGFLVVTHKKKNSKKLGTSPNGKNTSRVKDNFDMEIDNFKNKAKKLNIPPIFLEPPNNWQMLITKLSSVASSLKNRMAGRYMKLEVESTEEFRSLQALLLQEKARFKTHVLDEDKPLKAVIRCLPFNTDILAIKYALENEGFIDVAVTKMYKGPVTNKQYMPLFHVTMPNNPGADKIYSLDYLMGTQVKVEQYKGKKGPAQCYKCNGFFHTATACNLPASCLKCAGNHDYKMCNKAKEDPCKCINCGGPHPANFRECPKFPKSKPTKSKFNNSQKNTNCNEKIPTPRAFSSRKVESNTPWANVAQGKNGSATPVIIQNSDISKSSVPADAFSVTDFIKNLLAFEQQYKPAIVLKAFQNALPALRSASTDVDRVFHLYENIIKLV